MEKAGLLFLLIALTNSQEKCRNESQNTLYYIYNTTVEIEIFYCIHDVGIENCNSVVRADYASRYCPIHRNVNGVFPKRSFCQFTGHVNLLDGIVTLAVNTTCQYKNEHCNDPHRSKKVFWIYQNVSSYSLRGYNDTFHTWIVPNRVRYTDIFSMWRRQGKSIENEHISLKLIEKTKFNGVNVWKTNYKDIIVSKQPITNLTYTNYLDFTQNLKTSKRLCESEDINPENLSKSILRMWYIYKHPIEPSIFGCQNSSTFNNLTRSICSALNVTFCKAVKKVYENYEKLCRGARKCVDQKGSNASLVFEREGELCGESVWYTNVYGLVASEKELGFYQSKNIIMGSKDQWDFSWFHPGSDSDSVDTLGIQEYYIIVPLVVCLLWILFKIVMMPVYLCSACGKQDVGGLSDEIKLKTGISTNY